MVTPWLAVDILACLTTLWMPHRRDGGCPSDTSMVSPPAARRRALPAVLLRPPRLGVGAVPRVRVHSAANNRALMPHEHNPVPERVDLAIIGAGAAGLMAAVSAGRAAAAKGSACSIVAFDGARTLGAKILVAGGRTVQCDAPCRHAGGLLRRGRRATALSRCCGGSAWRIRWRSSTNWAWSSSGRTQASCSPPRTMPTRCSTRFCGRWGRRVRRCATRPRVDRVGAGWGRVRGRWPVGCVPCGAGDLGDRRHGAAAVRVGRRGLPLCEGDGAHAGRADLSGAGAAGGWSRGTSCGRCRASRFRRGWRCGRRRASSCTTRRRRCC
jgi:hypothetical protein